MMHKLSGYSETVANLSELMMLEIFMHFLYLETADAAHEGLKQGDHETVNRDDFEYIHHTAQELAIEELGDISYLLKLLRERVDPQDITELLCRAIHGPFPGRTNLQKVSSVLDAFAQQAEQDGEHDISTWLAGLKREERSHEKLLTSMQKRAAPHSVPDKIQPDLDLTKTFLTSGIDYVLSNDTHKQLAALAAFQKLSNAVQAEHNAEGHIARNCAIGRYAYWSYTVA